MVTLAKTAEIATQRSLEFEVEPRAFSKIVEVMEKLLEDGCFEARGNDAVVLSQMDPSHVSLVKLEIGAGDLVDLKTGSRVCVSMEKLKKVLKRVRTGWDESVRISASDEKVMINFPSTRRQFSLERVDMEPEDISRLPQMQFNTESTLATKELRDVLKDVEDANNVKLSSTSDSVILSTEEGYSKRFQKGDPGLMGQKVKEPSIATYNRDYLEKMTSEHLDAATLSWSKDMPLEVSYTPMPHSRLAILLAPRIEVE